MKLKLILPVADTENTRRANEGIPIALKALDQDTEVSICFIDHGFESLDSITRVGYNCPGIAEQARLAEKEGMEGIFINCVADPGVDMARELVSIPVFGGFRSCMMMALVCGKRIAIIIPGREDLAGTRLLEKVIENNPEFKESIVLKGFTNLDVLELHDKKKLLERLVNFSKEAREEFNCDCVMLGCTAMSYILSDLREALRESSCRVTVLEPLTTGMKLLETFVKLGLNNSAADQRIENDMTDIK